MLFHDYLALSRQYYTFCSNSNKAFFSGFVCKTKWLNYQFTSDGVPDVQPDVNSMQCTYYLILKKLSHSSYSD